MIPGKHSIAIAASILALSATAASAADVELNVVSWGGAYTRSQLNAYQKPYMAEHPEVQLNSVDYSGGLAEVRAQSEADVPVLTARILPARSSQSAMSLSAGTIRRKPLS